MDERSDLLPVSFEASPNAAVLTQGIKGMNRQLTAIMFADMVGYTALMQEDEDQAKTNRDRNRESLVRQVGEHNGKILQFYGDGALSVFRSAIQAVEAAIAVQGDVRTIGEKLGVATVLEGSVRRAGDRERTLDNLEEAVERRLGMVVFLNSALLWEELRSIPRFQKLVRRVGIPGANRES